ncbi:Ig-like domain-containing protein [Robertkochia marina]|nr:Ig-like domain-containing protein [Robertkochia marina]
MMYRPMSLLLLLVLLMGCSSGGGDDAPEAQVLTLNGTLLNGASVNGSPADIPLSTTLEMRFSASVDRQKFESSLSITDNNGAIPYTVNYANASATAVITLGELQPMTQHTVQLMSGVMGAAGERLNDGVSFTFTTQAGNSYTACTTGSVNCLRSYTLNVGGTDYGFDFYSNYDVLSDPEFVWEGIENLMVVVHGQNRNADEYFQFMNQTISGTSLQGNTLVVAPYFKEEAAAEGNELFWGSSWRFGGNAGNVGTAISSFDVVDAMITAFSNSSQFPDRKNIFVTGHSSGASFTHYYSLSSDIADVLPGVNFEYSVLNSQYFFYPTDRRYDEDTNSFETPASCTGFNSWPYGYNFVPEYVETTSDKNAMVQRLGAMNMVLFHGQNDTSTTGTLNTTDCGAVLLGSNRLERGRNYDRYLNTYFPNNNRDLIEVPNTGHNAAGMYGSQEFKSYLEARNN